MAFGYDGSVRIKADLNHSDFDRGLSAMTGKVQSFSNTLKKLAGLVTVAFGTAAIINFGKESIKLASDIEEVQNVIDVTFGQGAAQIEEFARSAATAFGMSELAAKQYTGTLGAMLKSSGFTTGQAQEMATTLTGLAGDIASFYNLDIETAFEKIRSGISGEIEPLRQLGINLSVANMEAYALANGLKKSYSAMSGPEQTLLRYNYLLSVTTDAQGDFARTSGSFANQIRILQLNFDQLRIAVGNALIPIAQAVLPSINAIISALTKLATVFAQVTALLFGKSAQVKATNSVASSAETAAEATDKLADSTSGAGSAAKQTAKDLKGVLAGFDELNILASNAADSASGSGGGAGGVSVPEIEIPSYESEIEDANQLEESFSSLGELFVATLDKMLAAMPEFKQTLLDFAENFNEFNQKLYDAFTFPGVLDRVKQFGVELADALNGLVNAIDWELWGRTLGAGLNLGLNFLTSFIYEFDWINLGNKLAEFINGLVYEVDWEEFGRLLWAKFKIALETFAGFITGLDMPALAQAASDIIMGFFNSMKETLANIDWAEIGRQVARFLNGIDWIGVISSIGGALKEMVGAALELVGGFISEADPDTLLIAAAFFGSKLLGKLATSVIAPIAKEIGSNLIKNIAEAITGGESGGLLAAIGSVFSKIGEVAAAIAPIVAVVSGALLAISNFLTMLADGFSWVNEALMLLGIAVAAIGAVVLGVPATVAAVVAGIVAAVATLVVLVKEHWEEIKEAFIGAWEAIKEAWNAAGEWFNTNVIQPVVEFFTGLWENVTQLATDAWNGIVEIWQAVSGWFNENVIQPMAEFFTQLWEDVTQFASDAWDGIVAVWDVVASWFDENIIQPVSQFFSDMWDNIKEGASSLWNGIQEIWGVVAGWFQENVIDPVKNFFTDLWDGVKSFASDAWDGVTGVWDSAANWFNETVVEPIKNFFSGLFDGIGKAASAAWDGIKSTFSNVGNWFSNNVTSKFSSNGRAAYSAQQADIAVASYTLPHLANGAVIPPNQQFAAILGDQRSGMNIEAPAKLIKQMAYEGIMEAMSASGGSSQPIQVNVMLDRKVLARAMINEVNSMTRSSGKSPLYG